VPVLLIRMPWVKDVEASESRDDVKTSAPSAVGA
jgi:hypothetical protein